MRGSIGLAGALALNWVLAVGCANEPRAFAGQVTARSQLIGGPRALGEIGDWRLSNGKVRFIVQDLNGDRGSRVYGTFGGSLIDADLARPDETADPRTQLNGRDGLGELFPAFFLSAIEPTDLKVIDDGSGGGTARIRIGGTPAEFITATRLVDQAALGVGLDYLLDYSLGPDDDFLTVTASIENGKSSPHVFPIDQFPIPIGFIGLFGDGQPLFLPGEAGYDVRFRLQQTYERKYQLPALAGLTTDVVAIEGQGVSYGLSYCTTCKSPLPNGLQNGAGFVWNHRGQYEQYAHVSPESMLLPFVSGTLFGLFLGEVPRSLPGGRAYSASLKLRVSAPSAAAQVDAVLREQGADIGTVAGVIREERSLRLMPFASVVFFEGTGSAGLLSTSARADEEGRFHASLPPGDYSALVRTAGHSDSALLPLHIDTGKQTYLEPRAPRTALLAVEVVDETGRRVPAKVTLDATYGAEHSGADPKTFLYDLRAGDPYRPTDLIPDTADPETRRWMETTLRTSDGRVDAEVRPGSYRVTVSRGPAYSIAQEQIELIEGQATRVSAKLERLLPANNRIAADLHVHAQYSVDSDVLLEDRARSLAAEGLDFAAMTEHNALVDLRPVVERTGLHDFLGATVGLELSSLEAGHFGAYPLLWQPVPATHGSIPWFRRNPKDVFDQLRRLGINGSADTVVQINHPRDSIQGYFSAYGMTGDGLTNEAAHDWPGKAGTFVPGGPGFGAGTFSTAFDAMEVLNGKRFDLMRTYRVPFPLPLPPLPAPCGTVPARKPCLGSAGTIVRDGTDLVAYPGAYEDWEHLLDSGRRVTAMGNSDSHKLIDGEVGYPRNLIDLGHPVANASEIDELEVARAVKAGRVLVTNGPEIVLTVIDPKRQDAAGRDLEVPIGDIIAPDADGTILVHVVVDAAPWIDVNAGALLVGRGGPCDETYVDCREITLQISRGAASNGGVRRLDQKLRVPVPAGKDSWVAATVNGDRSLWPVVIPFEIPPLLLNDAISALTSAFGIVDPLLNLKPIQVTQVRPFALTNPVFIDGNGDGRFGRAHPDEQLPQGAGAAQAGGPGVEGRGDDGRLVDLREMLARWAERR